MIDIKKLFEKACRGVVINGSISYSEIGDKIVIQYVGTNKKMIFEGGTSEQRYTALLSHLINTTMKNTLWTEEASA